MTKRDARAARKGRYDWLEAVLKSTDKSTDKPGVTPAGKLVAGFLFLRFNVDGQCWPGVSAIAVGCGLDRSTVQRGLRSLESAGFITSETPTGEVRGRILKRNGNRGDRLPYVYRMCNGAADCTPRTARPNSERGRTTGPQIPPTEHGILEQESITPGTISTPSESSGCVIPSGAGRDSKPADQEGRKPPKSNGAPTAGTTTESGFASRSGSDLADHDTRELDNRLKALGMNDRGPLLADENITVEAIDEYTRENPGHCNGNAALAYRGIPGFAKQRAERLARDAKRKGHNESVREAARQEAIDARLRDVEYEQETEARLARFTDAEIDTARAKLLRTETSTTRHAALKAGLGRSIIADFLEAHAKTQASGTAGDNGSDSTGPSGRSRKPDLKIAPDDDAPEPAPKARVPKKPPRRKVKAVKKDYSAVTTLKDGRAVVAGFMRDLRTIKAEVELCAKETPYLAFCHVQSVANAIYDAVRKLKLEGPGVECPMCGNGRGRENCKLCKPTGKPEGLGWVSPLRNDAMTKLADAERDDRPTNEAELRKCRDDVAKLKAQKADEDRAKAESLGRVKVETG